MNLADFQINQLVENLLPMGVGSNPKAKAGGAFSGTLKHALQASAAQPLGGGKVSNLQKPTDLEGKELLARLRQLFLRNGMDLDSMQADDTALAAFQRLMAAAGFDPKQVAALVEELKINSGNKGVRLSDLFKRFTELEEKKQAENLVNPSAVPYIESILARLLPNVEKRRLAFDGVRSESGGIDIDRLISNLKRILDNLPDKGRSVPDADAQQQVAKLMKDMGLAPESGIVTLEKFVARLQSAASAQDGRPAPGKGSTRADLRQFAEHLHPVKTPEKEAPDVNSTGLTKAAVRDGGKRPASPNGESPAAVRPSKPDAGLQASGKAPLAVEESHPALKPVETVPAEVLKPLETSVQTAAAEAKLPVRTLPAYVVNQVSRQIVRSFQNGTREIRLQLHPPNLGRLQMNIDRSGEILRVHIVTEQLSTQDLLMSHAADLKAMLTEQGLRLDKLDVQFDQNFDQSLFHARQESNRSNGRRQGGRSGRSPGGTAPPEEPAAESLPRSEGMLDLVA